METFSIIIIVDISSIIASISVTYTSSTSELLLLLLLLLWITAGGYHNGNG